MIIEVLQNDVGPVRVWEKPQSSEEYVIGVDVSEGKVSKDIHDPTGNKRDWSVATVLKARDAAMVAQYKSQVDTGTLAVDLYMLGYWYNEAMLAVETNSMGIGVVHMLGQAGYSNLYQPRVKPMGDVGVPDYLGIKSMGWVTTKATKPILIAAIHDDQVMSYGIALVVRQDFLGGRAGKSEELSRLDPDDAKIWRLSKKQEERELLKAREGDFYDEW